MGDDDFIIGTVGQLRPVKNQVELISALADLKDTLPNARLTIVGDDGTERARLESAARRYGISDRVNFLGELGDVRAVIAALDVFVVPSISETFSNAALEAMSMNKPVILSDTGGAREMVQDGVSGYIYKQGDVEYLATLIQQLESDPELRRTIGNRARQAVLDSFSFTRMAHDYQTLLSRSRH